MFLFKILGRYIFFYDFTGSRFDLFIIRLLNCSSSSCCSRSSSTSKLSFIIQVEVSFLFFLLLLCCSRLISFSFFYFSPSSSTGFRLCCYALDFLTQFLSFIVDCYVVIDFLLEILN